ncbi:MAG: hypothetical protein MI867_20135 [Pseudomonadales bacterium]|nr:hypothetical protein [Pseudomonadales bacterium]
MSEDLDNIVDDKDSVETEPEAKSSKTGDFVKSPLFDKDKLQQSNLSERILNLLNQSKKTSDSVDTRANQQSAEVSQTCSVGDSYDFEHSDIQYAAFGTGRDVIYNIHNTHQKESINPQKDPTCRTHSQQEDVTLSADQEKYEEALSTLRQQRIIVIEQFPYNHQLVSNILRKIRFDLQKNYVMRDVRGAIDLTQYSANFGYEEPNIVTVMLQREEHSLIPLLHLDEFNRITEQLSQAQNHLVIISQLSISQLRLKFEPAVDSNLYIWTPKKSTAFSVENNQNKEDHQRIENTLNDELKLKGFITFLLAFFPGLNVDQFNRVIKYQIEARPELIQKAKKKVKKEEGEEEIVETPPTWENEGDRIIRECGGVLTRDSDSGKGYFYEKPQKSEWLQSYLLQNYPYLCLSNLECLYQAYLESPENWSKFRELYSNAFLLLYSNGIKSIDTQWIRSSYETQRLLRNRPNRKFKAVVELINALSGDIKGKELGKEFHLSQLNSLLTKQASWRTLLEKQGEYDKQQLEQFQNQIADCLYTISETVGWTEDFVIECLARCTASSLLPFSHPGHSQKNDHLEIIYTPLSWYAKAHFSILLEQSPSDFFILTEKVNSENDKKINGKSPLETRCTLFQCYLAIANAIQEKVGHQESFILEKTDEPSPSLPFLESLHQQSYNQKAFVNLLVNQMRILRDIASEASFKQWLSYQVGIFEDLIFLQLCNTPEESQENIPEAINMFILLLNGLSKLDVKTIKQLNKDRLIVLSEEKDSAIEEHLKPRIQLSSKRLKSAQTLRKSLKQQVKTKSN